ncbi:MAG: hypothetical protein FK731_07825 [Asgard group archaeon]|nr:hypothetical protein [Asgard group archaeon]
MLLRKRILVMSIILQLILLVPISHGLASDDNNYPYILTEIAQIDTNYFAYDIEIVENIAYIANADFTRVEPGELVIVNVTDPTNPMKLSSYQNSQGFPADICVKNGLAFIADQVNGLEIINVTNLLNPQKIVTNPTNTTMAVSVAIIDDIAYVADLISDIHIINITDPFNLRRLNLVSLGGACAGIEIVDNFAYVIDHRAHLSGLKILDINNILNVVEVGSYMPNADFVYPYIYNELAIVVNHQLDTGEVRILNISNPSNIQELSQFKGESIGQKCSVVNQTLCMTDSDFGIKLLDISNPAEPFVIGKYNDDSGIAFDAKIINNIIFVADGPDGLEILQIETNTKTIQGFNYSLVFLSFIFIIAYSFKRRRFIQK